MKDTSRRANDYSKDNIGAYCRR